MEGKDTKSTVRKAQVIFLAVFKKGVNQFHIEIVFPFDFAIKYAFWPASSTFNFIYIHYNINYLYLSSSIISYWNTSF